MLRVELRPRLPKLVTLVEKLHKRIAAQFGGRHVDAPRACDLLAHRARRVRFLSGFGHGFERNAFKAWFRPVAAVPRHAEVFAAPKLVEAHID